MSRSARKTKKNGRRIKTKKFRSTANYTLEPDKRAIKRLSETGKRNNYVDKTLDRFLNTTAEKSRFKEEMILKKNPAEMIDDLLKSTTSKKRKDLIRLAETLGYLNGMHRHDEWKTPISIRTLQMQTWLMEQQDPERFIDRYLELSWNSREAKEEFESAYEEASSQFSGDDLKRIDLSDISKKSNSILTQRMILDGFNLGEYKFLLGKTNQP